MNKLAISLIASSALLLQSAFGQSIGISFVNNGSATGIDDLEADSMLPTDLAGAPPYTQTHWNNLGRYGSVNPLVLTNSTGATNAFNLQWDAGGADTTGTALGLGTPDGKLMDGFIYSWGPGAATPLANSIYNSSINNKPLVYMDGLKSWYTAAGAEGYSVVLYTTGYSYYETAEGWIESAIGNPFNNTLAEGTDLTPHVFAQDTGPYVGTYIRATGTSSGTQTSGANYMFFTGLTNDAVVLRCQSGGYGAGVNGFQLVPIFPAAPIVSAPTFAPSATVFAGVPVTITEAATGDPFHPALFYQWQKDKNSDGNVTNNILNATNSTFSVTPTNSASAYTISYQVIVSNSTGVSTSSVAVLTVYPAVAPIVNQDTTPGPGNGAAGVFAYVGGTISFNATFSGTPATLLWQSNAVNILNATNNTLTLSNLQLGSSANYQLTATNIVGGSSSTPSALTVLAAPAAPTSATPYPFDVYTNGPAAYWRFGETADNVGNSIQAYDYSGHKLNATYGNTVTDNQAGPQSPAYPGFETTNTGVTLATGLNNSFLIAPSLNLNANTATFTAWINPSSAAAFSGLLVWTNGTDKAGFGFGGTVNGSGIAELGYVWNTNSPATYNFHSGLYPLPNQWSFVALTITPTSSTIYLYYIDGSTGATNLLKSVQTINNLSEPFSGGTTWIGSDSSAARNFNGTLDEVAVFNKSLSEAQVQDLFLKGIGATGIAPTLSPTLSSTSTPLYSGQNVQLTVSNVSGTVPLTLQWQASPNGTTWTNIPGATGSASLLVNPLIVGNVFYQLVAGNSTGAGVSVPVEVTYTALPVSPAGLWTANFQITNNIINFATGGGVGHYVGRGILGTGMYWNVIPDTAGSFGFLANMTSVSDLKDDGANHSGIYCTMLNGSGFASATTPLPWSDVGNLLYQFVTLNSSTNNLYFRGVPDGTYNLAIYACDGSFGDRGTKFVVHDSLNGDQTGATVNQSPITPLAIGVNSVLFNNVHVSGGTLYVDVQPNTPLPTHDPNTEADINGAQLQLVSLDVAAPVVTLTITNSVSGSSLSLNWPQGILQSSTNVFGPWTSIFAPAPVTVPATNSSQFFRVQVR